MPPDFPKEVDTEDTFKAISANQAEMTVNENADMGQTAEFARIGVEQSLDKMERLF